MYNIQDGDPRPDILYPRRPCLYWCFFFKFVHDKSMRRSLWSFPNYCVIPCKECAVSEWWLLSSVKQESTYYFSPILDDANAVKIYYADCYNYWLAR